MPVPGLDIGHVAVPELTPYFHSFIVTIQRCHAVRHSTAAQSDPGDLGVKSDF
jgi:hypothetical protein